MENASVSHRLKIHPQILLKAPKALQIPTFPTHLLFVCLNCINLLKIHGLTQKTFCHLGPLQQN